MSSSLSGRVAIVTDSTRHVCLALTKELAENNDATFIACSRSKERTEELAEEINGSAFSRVINLTSDSSVQKLVSEVMANQRLIDILLNNAGYSFDRPNLVKRLHEVTEQEIRRDHGSRPRGIREVMQTCDSCHAKKWSNCQNEQ